MEKSEATPRDRFVAGLRLGVGFGGAAFVMGVTFGALARLHDWGALAPVVCSAVVFSGSAQFALLAALGGPGTLVPAVVAVVLMSARFLPMGIAVGPSLRGGPVRRALEAQAIVDASWAAAHQRDGRFDRELMMGATVPQWVLWVAGTAIGGLFAPPDHVMRAFGMDAAFPAFFLVLLLEELAVSRKARLVAGLGATIAAGLVAIVPAGLALIGSTVAALAGLLRCGREASGE
jgi:4-azaleucine resistance transporter AzlC